MINLQLYTVEFQPPFGLNEHQWWTIIDGLLYNRSLAEVGREIGRSRTVVARAIVDCHLQTSGDMQPGKYKMWAAEEDRTVLLYHQDHEAASRLLVGRSPEACMIRWYQIKNRSTSDLLLLDDDHPLTKYGRETYRAGHPLSWGAINKDTSLEGTPFK